MIPVLCFSRNSNNMWSISRHKVMSAVVLVIWVLFFAGFDRMVTFKVFLQSFLWNGIDM